MKKILHLFILLWITVGGFAQTTVQGHLRPDINTAGQAKAVKSDVSFTFDDIKYWVGEGENKAALVIQWNDGKENEPLVWGYKWDGEAFGIDMVTAIAKTDKRFYALFYSGTQYGTAIGGLGFDIDGTGTIGLALNGNTTYPKYPKYGIINTTDYDFDDWQAVDTNDHWQSGWSSKGYWSYWVKESQAAEFDYSGLGASSRVLQDGSWDAWNFMPDFNSIPLADNFIAIEPYTPLAMNFSKGIFFVNEDWFGWSNGSLNFLNEDDKMVYRAYSEVNNDEAFGCTTQFGTIYGDKFYFVSKQPKDNGDKQRPAGGRLVVAEAGTLKKIKGFDDIGGGDGRSFVGVNDTTGYIGSSNGIYYFDIKNMEVREVVEGTGGGSQYTGQIGNMAFTGKYVFAVKQSKGVYVIDTDKHTIIHTFEGSYNTLVQSKDGYVWLAQNNKLLKVHPYSLEAEEINLPSGITISGSWGAWNAGSLCASIKQNIIYWRVGARVIKYDIDTNTFIDNFFVLPDQDKQFRQIFYGAGLRIDPVTDNLVITTTESGYSYHYQNNWVHIVNNEAQLLKTIKLNNYYWFPAVTVFPDNHAPVISQEIPSSIILKGVTSVEGSNPIETEELFKLYLGDKVSDEDNLSAAIRKSIATDNNSLAEVAIGNDYLIIAPKVKYGTANLKLTVNSNGRLAYKDIVLNIVSKPEITKQPESAEKMLDESVTLSVEATGGMLTYQWYKNGQPIAGATENKYAITKTAMSDNGKYHCTVTNSEGSVNSNEVTLDVLNNDVSLYGLTINNHIWNIDNRYAIECGGLNDLTVKVTTEENAKVIYAGKEVVNKEIKFTIDKPSITNITFSIQSQDGKTTRDYTISIEKYFEFDKLVVTRWNNTLIVNNNTSTNGGYRFTAYKWFKDGVEIGSKQYYSAGSKKTDVLDKNAEYYVQVTTNEGEILRTCSENITLKSMEVKAYPNPVSASDMINVEVDLDQELMDNAVIEVYNTMGLRVGTHKVEGTNTMVRLPAISGTYLLKVKSGDFVKDLKVIVK